MSMKRIIACLDVRDGGVVKGVRFDHLAPAGDPTALAARYDAAGIDEVVLLDVTATIESRGPMLDTVARTAEALTVPLCVGGGVRSIDDASRLFDAGADKVTVNSAALARPDLIAGIAARYGSQAVVVSIDAMRTPDGHAVVFSRSGSMNTGRAAGDWAIEAARRGAGELLLTAIDRDGTRTGFDCALTAAISSAVPIPVIASGGAGSMSDFADVLVDGRADAALGASVFHFGRIEIPDLKTFLSSRGIPVRLVSPC